MTAGKRPGDLTPAESFVFRTALLPFGEFLSWGADLESAAIAMGPAVDLEAAVARDCARLREALRAAFARKELADAVFVASPDLEESMAQWVKDPESERGQKVERALVRYFSRMAGRATPFGLFAGLSVGALGDQTRLHIAPRADYERHTRLDNDYLFALTDALGRDLALRAELEFRPNSSLYRAAGRLRYAEARLDGKARSHHLVAVDVTDYLEATLSRAHGGARPGELAAALAEADPEVSLEEAEGFIGELIDSQILVSDLSPAVTGPEPIHGLVDQLRALPLVATVAERLDQARAAIDAIDASGVGVEPARYRAVAELLQPLPAVVELSRLFQVDMVKPAPNATLGRAVVAELERGVELLHRLSPRRGADATARFRDAFNERYEGREVPLVEALDEEVGIGFDSSRSPSGEASPLLEGLMFPGGAEEATVPWTARQAFLLRKMEGVTASGAQVLELTTDELERLFNPEPAPLPDSFSVMSAVAAASEEALDAGDFQVYFEGASGPSAARLLGRFCHASPPLLRAVEEHLRHEEAREPDAVFAEIVHLPEGRIGNILARPVLRHHEIAYLGISGAPRDRLIPITDLMVSVRNGRVVLRSAKLGREVIPRLSSAHNYAARSLGVYRFLCSLQSQGLTAGLGWDWTPLTSSTFLPRVVVGKLVLARAQWRTTGDEVRALAGGLDDSDDDGADGDNAAGVEKPKAKSKDKARPKAKGLAAAERAARFRAVQGWRARRRLPRHVLLADGDNELPVDLENPLSIDSFLQLCKSRDSIQLVEPFPGPDALCASGPEGRFVHELVVTFARNREPSPRPAPAAMATSPRRFAPGSRWLYAKLYTGTATADQVLREVVAPVREHLLGSGAADHWFFIRYGDPEWHVRVRFHGEPLRLAGEAVPALYEMAAPLLEDGRLWRVQLDTYEREVERYGGPRGVELAERLFATDSDAVLAIVETLAGDAGADARWRLAVRGIDLLLADLGFDLATRHVVMKQTRESFGREFRVDVMLTRQLGDKFRRERKSLEDVLDPGKDADSHLEPGFAALRARSVASAPIIAELHAAAAAGELTGSLVELAPSYVHMHVNRLLRSVQRAQELVLYDFLERLYEGRLARARKQKPVA